MTKHYSPQFRNQMVQKLMSPGGPSQAELADRIGVSQATLSRWHGDATKLLAVTKKIEKQLQSVGPPGESRRPQDWDAEEKLQLVQEAAKLEGPELGALLRRAGVHEADLRQWRDQVDRAALAALSGTRQRSADQKQIRKLEGELKRKDKVLAEAAALLVLSKKMQALWGGVEDDDTTGSDEE
jgi:transposase